MKITCQSCQAKYTIADEKVLGKIVKIRCKKCGATIVVNGNDPNATAGGASSLPDPPGGLGAEEGWMVNVADGDQRTMSVTDIVDAYRGAVITDDTFCWKDGMSDWLPLVEIAELATACGAGKSAPQPAAPAPKIQSVAPLAAAAPVAATPLAAAPRAAAASPGNGSGPGLAPTASPLAARRAGGGRAGASDLFGGVAQAGGEDDVLTSAPAGMPEPRDDAHKMTGERNENSVLFSLSALTAPAGPKKPQAPSGVEASGLIDIKQLSAQLNSSEEKKRSRIDDIMNLGGGGAFSPSLTAPVMSAPAVTDYAAGEGTPIAAPGPRSRALIFGAVLLGMVVIAGAIGGSLMLMKDKGSETADNAKTAASAASSEVAPSESAAPSATESASAAAAATESTAPSASSAKTTAASTKSKTTAPTAAATEGAATATAAAPKENSLVAAMAGAAAPPPAAAPAAAAQGSDQPFNMGEAKARLGAAAGSVQSCKKGDVTGTGRIVVVFAPSGAVQSATVSGPPFQGTPTGNCVAAKFHAVRVPAFSGSPFSVSKSFTIN
jgi:predicted Zn finger-like uncharacterized protein